MGSSLRIDASVVRDSFRLDIDLELVGGETVGLTGDIGSGKTTLLALIAGRLGASRGRITCQEDATGVVVWDDTAESTWLSPAERPVAILSQLYHQDLPEDVTGVGTVVANIERLARLRQSDGRSDADAEAAARALLSTLGLGDHVVDRLPWTFSGAEAQRIALARAVAPRATILLLDEPFGALDKRTGADIRRWLKNWLATYDGAAVIASTNVDDLDVLSDRIVSLDH